MKQSNLRRCVAALTLLLAACGGGGGGATPQKLAYPASAAEDTRHEYFNQTVAEPYQWLEDTMGDRTHAWVQAQNGFTRDYLRQLPSYADIDARVRELMGPAPAAAKTGGMRDGVRKQVVEVDGRWHSYQLNRTVESDRWRPGVGAGAIEVSVDNRIYFSAGANDAGRVLFDVGRQNSNPDDHIQLVDHRVSADGRFLVYRLIRNYSDLNEIHVVDLATGQERAAETIAHGYESFQLHGGGFFYVAAGAVSDPYTSAYNRLAVFYHRFGDSLAQDRQLYAGNGLMSLALGPIDEHDLFLYAVIGSKTEIYRLPLADPAAWVPTRWLGDDFRSEYGLLKGDGAQHVLVTTTHGSERKRLVRVPRSDNPNPAGWQELLNGGPDEYAEEIVACGDAYFAEMLQQGASRLVRVDGAGQRSEIALPGVGAVHGMKCGADDQRRARFEFLYSTLAEPPQEFYYDLGSGAVTRNRVKRFSGYDPDAYVMRRLLVPAGDGAQITAYIAHRKGLAQDGSNPAMIYVYGGFGVPQRPNFQQHAVPLLESGGIYVVAQVRGGSEYGNAWHDAGRGANKQQTYDDVIAVAEYLIREKFTSAGRLGLEGGSNGGLTTAAVAMQRPDLFAAVFPLVGVLDLLRYQYFTSGFNWYEDYGYSSSEPDFKRLRGLSPVHNVRPQPYPAMLVMTGQTDSRVVPSHSYKFVAAMQNQAGGANPYLMTAFPKSGHQMSDYRDRVSADTWAFFFARTGTAYRKP